MQTYKNILIDNGIKPTYQRIKILEFIRQKKTHLTVDEIYEALYKKVPTLSKTTIYNTLNIFRKHGLINVLSITESELRYDSNMEPHHHFLCRQCGQIFDVAVRCQYVDIKQVDGHKIEEIHGYFRGICAGCLNKSKE